MAIGEDANARVNLQKANVLLVESNQHAADTLAQIMSAFGVRDMHRCLTIEEAEKVAYGQPIDLIVIEPALREGDGYEFIKSLRRSGRMPVCAAPIIVITVQAGARDITRARNSGANFVVAKPLTPKVLLQRIQWIVRDKRDFVEVGEYVGPDRRVKFEGPPADVGPRRSTDLDAQVGDASEPNMSQNEIDSLMRPQRIML